MCAICALLHCRHHGVLSALTRCSCSRRRKKRTVAPKRFWSAPLHSLPLRPSAQHVSAAPAFSRALQIYKKRNEERRQQEHDRKVAREREVEAEITKRQIERLQREARVQQAQKEVWFKKKEEVAVAKAELKIYKEKTTMRQNEAVCLPKFPTLNPF
jgi:hypothetical protein